MTISPNAPGGRGRNRAVPDAGNRQAVIGSPSTQRYVRSLRPVFD